MLVNILNSGEMYDVFLTETKKQIKGLNDSRLIALAEQWKIKNSPQRRLAMFTSNDNMTFIQCIYVNAYLQFRYFKKGVISQISK